MINITETVIAYPMSQLINDNIQNLVKIAHSKTPRKALKKATRNEIKAIVEIALNWKLLEPDLNKRDLKELKPLFSKSLSLIRKRNIVLKNNRLVKRLVQAAIKWLRD